MKEEKSPPAGPNGVFPRQLPPGAEFTFAPNPASGDPVCTIARLSGVPVYIYPPGIVLTFLEDERVWPLDPSMVDGEMFTPMPDILRAVCHEFCINKQTLLGRRRNRHLATARFMAVYLMREHCPSMTWATIGTVMKRDHSSVIHAARRIDERLETDPELRATRNRIRARLGITEKTPATG